MQSASHASDETRIEAFLPQLEYTPKLLDVGEAVCATLYDEFEFGTSVRKLGCRHIVHTK